MKDLIELIKEKCLAEKLTTEIVDLKDRTDLILDEHETEMLLVSMAEERGTRRWEISNANKETLKTVSESDFQKFKLIKGYEAIWSKELETIECELDLEGGINHVWLILRRLELIIDDEKDKENIGKSSSENRYVSLPSPIDGVKILIGTGSLNHGIVRGFLNPGFFIPSEIKRRITIRFEGVKVDTHGKAKELLLKLSNSILFQIDLLVNLPVYLKNDVETKKELKKGRRAIRKVDSILKAPIYEYDDKAVQLYWYARNASDMPLLQYLAFYQVLEFYFPHYSYQEVQKRIKNLIKDPTFNPNNNGDITKIVEQVKLSSKGDSFGNERDQIKSTLAECVQSADLYDFLIENEARKKFFDVKEKNIGVAKQQFSLKNKDSLVHEVASRVYEIRCRIVHTKNGTESELLLPFSNEIATMKNDILLIQFLARKVLISSSRQITL